MSSVTDVVVLGDLADDDCDPFVSMYLRLPTCEIRLQKVPEQMYPSRAPFWDVWVGAGNYLAPEELVERLRGSWTWEQPDSVLVLWRHEEDQDWTIHKLADRFESPPLTPEWITGSGMREVEELGLTTDPGSGFHA